MKKIQDINNKLNKYITKKNILILTIIVSVLLLIPILWVSFYTVPAADDFSYGTNTINVLKDGGIFKLLLGSLKTVKEFYTSWQGTYSAIILFSLNPGVLGHNFYFLTTFIILGIFFFSIYYLSKQLLNKYLKIDNITKWIIILLFFLLSIETLVDKNQALYWWNGSSYYMIFFSLEIIEIALLIKQYLLNEKTKINTIILCILSIVIAGGNFIVALQQIIILTFLNIYLIIKKKDKSALIYLLLAIIGLGISAIAPGNKERAAFVHGMNPIKAIITSFLYALRYMSNWTNPLNIFLILLITILLIPSLNTINKKFSYPLLVIGLMYSIFSAEFTPTLYSMGTAGEGRLLNIIYISFLFFIIISLYYFIGYIRNLLIANKIVTTSNLLKVKNIFQKNIFLWTFTIILILGVLILLERGNLTSYETLKLIKSHEGEVYKKEWDDRYRVLENDNIKEVEFKKLTYEPYPIFFSDFQSTKDHWLNLPATEIYHKDYIITVE